jgi:hypothetical protein
MPELDFGNGYWRTDKDHNIYVQSWLPREKVWKALLLDDAGEALAKITFDVNGRNHQYGDLMIRKRSAQVARSHPPELRKEA